ncbi:MAG: phosphoribosylglycinamide formyltransferase [Pseudomonadota bacterium]
MTLRVAVFISGGGSNMEKLLDSMIADHPARPCVVLANHARAGGLAKASARGVPVEVVPNKDFGEDRASFERAINTAIRPYAPDIICLAGFMRVLSATFVAPWRGAMLNIHPSLLPKYPGLRTHARALAAGDRLHGCTVHEVTAVLDDGPVLGQAQLQVSVEDTAETLAARVLVLEHQLYPLVLHQFAQGQKEPVFLEA